MKPGSGGRLPRPATSEEIPRAVEFLLLFLMRWALFGLAGVAGLLLIAALTLGWVWWVRAVLTTLTFAAMVFGASIRPRGSFRFDRAGPIIVVPTTIRAGNVPGRDAGEPPVEEGGSSGEP